MPSPEPSETPAAAAFPWRRDLLWLALIFGLLFGFRLGSYPLGNPDEGRYAEIPREMVASGDWVTPRLNGVNYFEKPPLMYWATAGALELAGPSEWAMRAMPALFALGGLLLTYAAARRLYGRDAGLAAAAVLGTSLLYFTIAHRDAAAGRRTRRDRKSFSPGLRRMRRGADAGHEHRSRSATGVRSAGAQAADRHRTSRA